LSLEVVSESAERLPEYSFIPIGFPVSEYLDDSAIDAALAGNAFSASPVATPYWKDYDSYPGARPTDWPTHFDVESWKFFAARVDGQRVGGAVLVPNGSNDVELVDGRFDLALLWDLRVAPDFRRLGVGVALLSHVVAAATQAGVTELRAETQQVNVPACRFYAERGFRLKIARRGAYPTLPEEIQLLWDLHLG
jgi:ribosomal protein S18 acetylase RimI-like enzyme